MGLRRDAFRGLADFGAAMDGILADVGTPETRLTVGKLALSPNFPHSVAGEATFSLVGRDTDEAVLAALAAACRAAIGRAADAHGLGAEIHEQSFLPPTPLDRALAEEIAGIAAASGLSSRMMPSGAGHDAQTFARHCPSALIFVPSVGGVSHAPHEWTRWPDALKGATLLARAVARLATR
jgi:N-carbamoyl-L-amino-acid hydrolase